MIDYKTIKAIPLELEDFVKSSVQSGQHANPESFLSALGQVASDARLRQYTYKADVERELMDKLNEILRLKGLDIDLIGFWIWVRGNTKPHKEALKTASLRWHSKRKCWYYKPKGWKGRGHSKGGLVRACQQIRL